MVSKKTERTVGVALLSWWLILLIGAGLLGNGLLLFKAIEAGNVMATLLFGSFFCGACVYLYRTYQARDEIQSNFRD